MVSAEFAGMDVSLFGVRICVIQEIEFAGIVPRYHAIIFTNLAPRWLNSNDCGTNLLVKLNSEADQTV
jgi:hypothetical protein